MKSVILIRHTKSDWSNLLKDFDRPIRQDRKIDTILIAKEIAEKGTLPQQIISSPAVRTLQTAEILCTEWKYPFKDITKDKSLYECMANDILTVIQKVDDKFDAIAIVCHNPAITVFVNQYSNASIDDVPTTGAIRIDFDVEHWKDIKGNGKARWFIRPKELK